MEESTAFLRKTNEHGVSVYSHLTEVLATLLAQKPEDALDMLEGVSLACKKTHYAPEAVVLPEAPPVLPGPPTAEEQASSTFHSSHAKLLGPKTGEEEPAEGEVRDTLADSALFQSAGVGLSKNETYLVYASLLQCQQKKKLSSVRFFGKVLGTTADYYIAEGTYSEPPEPPEEPPPPPPGAPVEESGAGCNLFTYFATTDLSGEWTALPDVTPQQIVASTKIRKFLTGSLTADVRAYPPFPGKEDAYLRALLARIVHATTLCPVGKFVMPEDAEPGAAPVENEAEDYTPIAASACASGWCTRYMGILDIGRTTNPPSEEEEAEEGEEKPKGPEPQKEIAALSSISAEEWATSCYVHGGPPVAIARSTRWPGAYCAYKLAGKTQIFTTMYIGYGHDVLAAPFRLEAPPPFELEPDEVAEQEDMPLEQENEAVISKFTAELAEEAANLPDAEEGEGY
jgi:radial spoke head protein 4A